MTAFVLLTMMDGALCPHSLQVANTSNMFSISTGSKPVFLKPNNNTWGALLLNAELCIYNDAHGCLFSKPPQPLILTMLPACEVQLQARNLFF